MLTTMDTRSTSSWTELASPAPITDTRLAAANEASDR
jgi:hypothetical protein